MTSPSAVGDGVADGAGVAVSSNARETGRKFHQVTYTELYIIQGIL